MLGTACGKKATKSKPSRKRLRDLRMMREKMMLAMSTSVGAPIASTAVWLTPRVTSGHDSE